jgi:DNA mismatch repair protein MutH
MLSPPPSSEDELLGRARDLEGMTVGALAELLGCTLPATSVRGKGRVGQLIECALGASAKNLDLPDFPHLGIELKTVPLDAQGRVKESTYVCYLDMDDIEHQEWESSRVWRKLKRVLWIPIEWQPGIKPSARHIGTPMLWSPTKQQQLLLRSDWTELVGCIAVGGIDEISAHRGQVLQIRPKAANASVRMEAFGPQGEILATVPRGFYLRARFTEQILWSPSR